MSSLIVRRGSAEDVGKIFSLDRQRTVVGRLTLQNKPDIELSADVISRQHLEIVKQDDKYYVKDLGSTNGTFLNGLAIKMSFIKDGDELQVGNTVLKVRFS